MNKMETSEFEVVEPGFVCVRYHGQLSADETNAVLDAIEGEVMGREFFMFEADMGDIQGASPEARRVAAQRLKNLPNFAMAVVGGSFAQRMIAKLVLTAIRMLGSDKTTAKFFSDSDSARAWLRDYAKERQAKGA